MKKLTAKQIIALLACIFTVIFSITVISASAAFITEGGFGENLSENDPPRSDSSKGSLFQSLGIKNAEPPESVAVRYLQSLDTDSSGNSYCITTDGTRLYIDALPSSSNGRIIHDMLKGCWSFKFDEAVIDGTDAYMNVYITCPDTSLLASPLHEEMMGILSQKVSNANSSSEIYDENLNFRKEILDDAFWQALTSVCSTNRNNIGVTVTSRLFFTYDQKQWKVKNPAEPLNSLDSRADMLYLAACENLSYIPKAYKIDENATSGPVPDQTCFGTTDNPADVTALLQKPYARALINGQTLNWNESIQRIPGTLIRYYLDETILMIQWQEEEAGMVGTFAEVFIADGSQLRRKIAGDTFGDMNFRQTTEFSRETNAILGYGGDFYNHGRNCGIVVYNRSIYRFDPVTCDTCYITSSGDMLFSYREQFSAIEEAQQFVADNDVLFSLCFGPVMIDNGVDVTPGNYAWGEINDTYARAALGMLGERHYLTMNMNCGTGHLYNYATLRQAADAMVKRGCIKAYTMDGGQTCTTVVNGELINPVQFGWEKAISDIIYFATAVPNS